MEKIRREIRQIITNVKKIARNSEKNIIKLTKMSCKQGILIL